MKHWGHPRLVGSQSQQNLRDPALEQCLELGCSEVGRHHVSDFWQTSLQKQWMLMFGCLVFWAVFGRVSFLNFSKWFLITSRGLGECDEHVTCQTFFHLSFSWKIFRMDLQCRYDSKVGSLRFFSFAFCLVRQCTCGFCFKAVVPRFLDWVAMVQKQTSECFLLKPYEQIIKKNQVV